MQFPSSSIVLSVVLTAAPLFSGVEGLCKKAVGIRVMTNNSCHVVACPSSNCIYTPCHYTTVYHGDGSSTGGFEIAGAAPFSQGKQDQIYEWGYFGNAAAKGMSVYANGCGGNDGNGGLGGMGCDVAKRTNRGAPGVSKVYYDCGQVPAVPA